jgi:hypothetical protein
MERIFPTVPGSGQEQPKEPIRPSKFWATELSLQNGKLLAKSQVFQGEV